MRTRPVVTVIAAGALAACSSGGTAAGGTATVSRPAPTTTATDPWAVPLTVTPAYLDRVLAALDHLEGEAGREVRTHGAITPRFLAIERSFRTSDSEVQLDVQGWQKAVDTHFVNLKAVPGDPADTLTSILPSPPPCVFATVRRDFSAVAVNPPSYPTWYVALVPTAVNADNPTHWALAADAAAPAGGPPPTAAEACSP